MEWYHAYDCGGDYWIILGPANRKFCDVGRGKRRLARKLARFANKVRAQVEEGITPRDVMPAVRARMNAKCRRV